MRILAKSAAILVALLGMLPISAKAQSAGWLNASWLYRNPVTITNTAGSALTNFQVNFTLGSTFSFSNANTNGSDIRITASDGVTQIPFWIETWNATSKTASIWAQVPSVPTAGTTIYMYYGNSAATSASSGSATFLFFDDFDSATTGLGYWTLGATQTELVQDQGWEASAPHTLSVLKLNMGGHTYWGYYGLQAISCGGVGLAWSEDLVTWTKDSSNPMFLNGRWPRVVQVGSTLYMAYTYNYCETPQINLASSTDGINWTVIKTLVPANYGSLPRNQNPDLWLNPNDGRYYLYWYNGNDSNNFNIMSRSATSPTGLDSTSTDKLVLNSSNVLAAPDMFYYNGTYFLAAETTDSGGLWNVLVYSSTTGPTSGFTLLPGNPVMNNGAACMFQTPFGTTLHEYYCLLTGSTWTIQHRAVDLTSARPGQPVIDTTKWTASGGNWSLVQDTQPNGSTGYVAQGSTSAVQILKSSYSGTNYVLEAYGKQVLGNDWGLAFRVNGNTSFYSLNLYDNLDGSPNLYAYRWSSGAATNLGTASVGTVNASTWYKLSVRANGSGFDIYKDNVLQFHTSDSTYASGNIGLYGENGTRANFNNVLVRQYAVTDPTSVVGSQQALTGLASLTLNPTSVLGGVANSTGTVTLATAAPSGGSVVTLSSSNTAAAKVPASVTVPSGATTATFTVTSVAVATATNVTISGTFSATQTATLTVNPPSVTSVSLNPTTVTGGLGNSTGTVTLNAAAPTGGLSVTLSSSNTAAATVPASVTVAAGATSATFTVTSNVVTANTTSTISATSNGTASAVLAVGTGTSGGGVVFVRATGNSGESVKYTVAANPSAGNFLAVFVWQTEAATDPTVTDNLASNYTLDCDLTFNQGFGTRRLTVYHLQNAPSGITGISVTPNKPSRTIVAEYFGMPTTGTALDVCGTVNNQTTNVTSWSTTATTTTGQDLVFGLADTGLAGNAGYAASGAWTGRLHQSDTVDADDSFVEDALNLPAGSYTGTGTTTSSVRESSVVVAFKAGGQPVSSVTLNPASLVGGSGNTSTGTVTLGQAAPTGGALVTLTSGNTAVATVPANVTVTAGATSANFTITTSSVTLVSTSLISATYNSSTQSATLTVNPAVASVTLNPATVGGGTTSTGTVTLGQAAPTGGALVTLTSGTTSVATVPANVTVAAGATTANFTITTTAVTSTSTSLISASYNSSTQSATLTVTPAGVASFVRAAGNSGESVNYTVSIAPAAGDFLAVFVFQTEGAATPAITDNLASAYTLDCNLTFNQGFGTRRLTVYHLLKAGTGITGISVTPNTPSRAIVAEYSGMAATAGLDVCGAANTNTSSVTSWSSTATATTGAKDVIIGLADTATSGNAGYAASGVWVGRLTQHDSINLDDSYMEDQLNVAAGTYTAAGTTTSAVTESAVVVGFKVQ